MTEFRFVTPGRECFHGVVRKVATGKRTKCAATKLVSLVVIDRRV